MGSGIAITDTVDFSIEIAMPLDSTAECAEPRRGLKTTPKLLSPPRSAFGDTSYSAVINYLIFRQCRDHDH